MPNHQIKTIIISSFIWVPSFSVANTVNNALEDQPIELEKVVVLGTQKESKMFKIEQSSQDLTKNMV